MCRNINQMGPPATQDTTRHDGSAPQDTCLLSSVSQVYSSMAGGQHHTDTAKLGAGGDPCIASMVLMQLPGTTQQTPTQTTAHKHEAQPNPKHQAVTDTLMGRVAGG